jgi:hypothetical protein
MPTSGNSPMAVSGMAKSVLREVEVTLVCLISRLCCLAKKLLLLLLQMLLHTSNPNPTTPDPHPRHPPLRRQPKVPVHRRPRAAAHHDAI